MEAKDYCNKLTGTGLKVTPQQIAVLEALASLNNHPSNKQIMDYIHKKNPGIATAKVYKVLETMVTNGLIQNAKTERDSMRYDAITVSHHHFYCTRTGGIADYIDPNLDQYLRVYFSQHTLKDFAIEVLELHFRGKFIKTQVIEP